MYCEDVAMFPEKFHFGQERRIIPKICQWWWWGGGGSDRASFFETFIFFFQIRIKNGTKNMWDYPTLFLWDNPTFFSIYPTSIPQKGVVHFCQICTVNCSAVFFYGKYLFTGMCESKHLTDFRRFVNILGSFFPAVLIQLPALMQGNSEVVGA